MEHDIGHGSIRRLATLLLGALLASYSALEVPSVGSQETASTATFQSGQGGYASTVDGYISDHDGGNGITDFTSNQGIIWKKTGTDPYEGETLIRFDNLSLPAGAQVTSATLQLTFEDWYGGNILRGYYLKNSWSPPGALGWVNRELSLTWAMPGAKGMGTDLVAGVSFSDTNWTGTGNVTKTYPLDDATVQGWLDNASTNQGIILVNSEVNDKYLRVFTSEDTTVAHRPLLTITYTTGGGGGPGCTSVPNAAWVNQGFAAQTGSFTAEYDVIPSAALIDASVGLSMNSQSAYTGLATITRFNPSGFIDAQNGGTYEAVTAIAYSANVTYHFRLVVDRAAHTYSAYMRSGGEAEQTLASGYAFQTEQASVTQLDTWNATTATSGASMQVCSFTLTTGGVDTQAPTVTMTAPANGATVQDSITLSTNAFDNVGIAGVQFLVDGGNIGTEGTSSPYAVPYDTTVLANGTHQFSARARDAAGNTATAPPVTVTFNNPSSSAGHPRMFLDVPTLATLRQKAQAADARWTALWNTCNSYLGGTVLEPPTGDYCHDSCDAPTVCCGYQGNEYYRALLSVSLCYQVGSGIGDPNTSQWAQKGADILTKMTDFTFYQGDSGYGIRFFGPALALGYDWLYPTLSASLKSSVVSSMNNWISWFEAHGLGHDHPVGNYFAGYYAAKAYIGLATEGEPGAITNMWTDFLNRVHRGGANSLGTHVGVASYYTSYLDGGGWPDGWQYGDVALRNMSEPSLAAQTAKNVDLVNSTSSPYHYPLNSALHLIEFSWPSRNYMDDRDTVRGGGACPGNAHVPSTTATLLTTLLARWNDPLAAMFHNFVRTIRGLGGNGMPDAWVDFLYWDDGASEQDYTTLPRSYRATNYVAMRSDWTPNATWASLRAAAYIDYINQSEQYPDAGALVITRGNTPFLVNPLFLHRCYTETDNAQGWDNQLYNEIYNGAQAIFNVFYNTTTSGQTFVEVDSAPPPATGVARFEDQNGYVYTRAQDLADVYPSSSNVTAWSRDVVFFRNASVPGVFVVYDRTTSGAGDPHMHWHFPPAPAVATPPSTGAKRYDVTDGVTGFKGALTTLLPANAVTQVDQVFSTSRLWRVVVRPPSPTSDMRWLTVLDPALSPGAAALGSVIMSSANVKLTFRTPSDADLRIFPEAL